MTDVRVEITGAAAAGEADPVPLPFDIEAHVDRGIEEYGLRAPEEWKAAFRSLCHQNKEGIRTGSVFIAELVEKADELV